jgi:hypothetical protein
MKNFDEFVNILDVAIKDPQILNNTLFMESYAIASKFAPPNNKMYMKDEGHVIGVEGLVSVDGYHIEEFTNMAQ